MATHDLILKIRRLFALSKSSNAHEAATAASIAQKLCAEHRISMAEVRASEVTDASGFVSEDVYTAEAEVDWKNVILYALCDVNACEVMVDKDRRGVRCFVYGSPDAVHIVKAMFSEIVLDLVRIVDQHDKSDRWKNQWLMGAGFGIEDEIKSSTKKAMKQATTSAMVVVREEKKAVAMAVRQEYKVTDGGKKAVQKTKAMELGEEFGKSRHMGKSLPAQR